MYPAWVLGGVLLLGIWLLILSILIWREKNYLRKLFPKNSQGDIREKLEEILGVLQETQRREQLLTRNLRQVSKEGLNHMQKIAVLRYNPYQDTGGDQSFSVAVLNGLGSGFILTSLHTRGGTRVYTKNIALGKSELRLSKEEEEVIDNALKEDTRNED